MKVVLNRAVGSCFSLSSAALAKLAVLKGLDRRQRDPHGPIWAGKLCPRPKVVDPIGYSALNEMTEISCASLKNLVQPQPVRMRN